MTPIPEPPRKFSDFIERFPMLGEAWEAIHQAVVHGWVQDVLEPAGPKA
jgi:hypothetical protein